MTRHVKEIDLALYASGDLRLWQRASVHLHVQRCALCRESVEEFRADSKALQDAAAELPEGLDWARLSAEMTANVRVGLEAGECVNPRGKGLVKRGSRMSIPRLSIPVVWRPLVLASAVATMLVVLLAGGWWLNMPAQDTKILTSAVKRAWTGRTAVLDERDAVIEASSDGIELRKDGGALGVSQDTAQLVTVSVSTQGSASAHYVDQDTGQVTITSVYAQ